MLANKIKIPGFVRSSGWIYSAQMGRGVLALGVAALSAHLLSVEELGIFSFVQSFFLWLALFAELGVAISAARLLTQTDQDRHSQILSAFIALLSFIAVLAALLVVAVSPMVEDVFGFPVAGILVICAVPGIGIIWLTALREILPALGQMKMIAFLEVTPWALVLAFIGALGFKYRSAEAFALFFTGSYFMVSVIVLLRIGAGFQIKFANIKSILAQNRKFGSHMYLARLIGTGGFILDIPLLAYFTKDSSAIALYAMAKALTAPLTLIGQSISTALFRSFATSSFIPRNALSFVLSSTLLLALAYGLLGKMAVDILLPDEYENIVPYVTIWVVTACLQSLYQLPNMYLRAQGQGHDLRNLAVIFGLTAIAAYLILIPAAGILGACLAALSAVTVWTLGAWVMYIRYTKRMDKV